MSSRNYDVILTVDNASNFEAFNVVIGNTSLATGVIANVDTSANTLKVKLNNTLLKFSSSESLHSNTITISGSGAGKLTRASTFTPNVFSGNVTTATANITATAPSGFFAEKNAFQQNPIVRLYEIFYPGEWFPTNEAGNPGGDGAGRAFPVSFPIRFADVRGDFISDLSYNVTYAGTSYLPFPVNFSSIEQSNDGKISELNLTVFNFDNILTALIEDPFLVGNNTSNACQAIVNGELVHGIDPRTIDATPSDFGSVGTEGFDVLTRARANGLAYNESVVGIYGQANASFTKTQTDLVGGTWREDKKDTRDLLGGVVRIKTTFANFLDHWPEYSTVKFQTANVIEVYNSLPYRVGDNVRSSKGTTEATIQSIEENRFLFLSNELDNDTSFGDPIYIVNADKDQDSFIEDIFKIDQLESMNNDVGEFGLVSWLQYFKTVTPKRKFYKNTCQWVYKGEECQYPGPGGGAIPGTNPVLNANTNPIGADNQTAADASGDVCGKNIIACTIRNNQIHFGGFPATGRTVPQG
jgi:phage-related protein